jgi:hypothetical protein
MTIINDDSRVVNELEASLTDDARVIIYDCRMFIVQATDPHGFAGQGALDENPTVWLDGTILAREKKRDEKLVNSIRVYQLPVSAARWQQWYQICFATLI